MIGDFVPPSFDVHEANAKSREPGFPKVTRENGFCNLPQSHGILRNDPLWTNP
jgi:hypothetical protein